MGSPCGCSGDPDPLQTVNTATHPELASTIPEQSILITEVPEIHYFDFAFADWPR
jgi:hypothetical protein